MRRMTFLAALVPLLAAGLAYGAVPEIVGSAHDFGADGYTWAQGEICKPCHTPHNAQPTSVSSDLFNHYLTTASYTMMDGTTGTTGQALDRVSMLCMSCHDGTVALDAFGIAADGTRFTGTGATFRYLYDKLGTDLTVNHPVGNQAIYYAGAVQKATYENAGTITYTDGTDTVVKSVKIGTGSGALSLYAASDVPTNWVVSCRTCHNPHGAGTVAGQPYPHLLNISNAESALCLTCHTK